MPAGLPGFLRRSLQIDFDDDDDDDDELDDENGDNEYDEMDVTGLRSPQLPSTVQQQQHEEHQVPQLPKTQIVPYKNETNSDQLPYQIETKSTTAPSTDTFIQQDSSSLVPSVSLPTTGEGRSNTIDIIKEEATDSSESSYNHRNYFSFGNLLSSSAFRIGRNMHNTPSTSSKEDESVQLVGDNEAALTENGLKSKTRILTSVENQNNKYDSGENEDEEDSRSLTTSSNNQQFPEDDSNSEGIQRVDKEDVDTHNEKFVGELTLDQLSLHSTNRRSKFQSSNSFLTTNASDAEVAAASGTPEPVLRSQSSSSFLGMSYTSFATSNVPAGTLYGFYGAKKKTYREVQFERILNADVVNLQELSSLAWNGIPIQHRGTVWKLLLGYLPANASRRSITLKRKRTEYIESCVAQHYDCDDDSRTVQEQEILRQVLVDVPRTQPNVRLFRNDKIKRMLSRLLYIWAMRHPASSYVQGINDVTTPLVAVFLIDYFIQNNHINDSTSSHNRTLVNDVHNNGPQNTTTCVDGYSDKKHRYNVQGNTTGANSQVDQHQEQPFCNSPSTDYDAINYEFIKGLPDLVLEGHVMNYFPDEQLNELEADVYWCLTNLLAGIQDHYTADQPGLQRMVGRLEELTARIDAPLCKHLRDDCGIMFLQFSFKWMNCLLLREFELRCVFRLWDTYLSEQRHSSSNSSIVSASSNGRSDIYDSQKGRGTPSGSGSGGGAFEDFHVYVCAAFLCQFSARLQQMTFDEVFTFLQDMIPTTQHWTDDDIEILLSQAYVLSTLFKNSDAHLTSTSPQS